ncbi:MAG: hypothetical protein J4F32_00495 [Dehalococcoidia bacterium]|nr:hypothetical protein [Dehalococcoidia bacterium]
MAATMPWDEYVCMFKGLGFQSFKLGRLLRHSNGMPPPHLYFNDLKGRVSFAARASQGQYYSARLWDRLPPQQEADNQPRLITVVPKSGKEREAFVDLLNG